MSDDTVQADTVAANLPEPVVHEDFLERTVDKLKVDFPHLFADWDALALWFSKHV